ncbi:tetratricopeptide repeat protein [Hydromonas duriensis]|uniref:Tetratricopeptide repeat protein n=1 Tax=Hydromonas duriensis TaxID=1527608 RepID=A0A4R6YA13_9BURK|nr:hypothetical protein [Hydromonas duriensis]TDR32307.1 hypothetical protein DFR44_10421 [Hydromonas duriensis]
MFKYRFRGWLVWVTAACLASGVVQAKTVAKKAERHATQYVLTDPVTGAVLPYTPYVLFTRHVSLADAGKVWYTDAQGRTRAIQGETPEDLNNPAAPVVLVQAEGKEGHMLLVNLHDVAGAGEQQTGQPTAAVDFKGAPYVLWNKVNHQALCGHSNAQGFTQAYFVPRNSGWDKEMYVLRLKGDQPCREVRASLINLFNTADSSAFEQGYDYAREHFVLNEKQESSFIYHHVGELIENKTASIDQGANKRMITRAIDLAKSTQDAGQLNMLGYSLGFERKDYKRGLPLIDQALSIKPNDCYFLNSKGYLLMRQGDLKQSRSFLEASDAACQANRAQLGGQEALDMAYPIAVNYAHLAENYGLSGDESMANDYFNRALKEGSARAKNELVEVARHLSEKNILNSANLQLFALYLAYAEKVDAENSDGQAEPAASAARVPEAEKKAKKQPKKK